MDFQEIKSETISSLVKKIDDVILGVEHIGGYNSLNEYGRGQYDMMRRMKNKLNKIQKASGDASDKDEN
ncbi:hypothetical protein [Streptococcus pluranimalium]|nr:hypothetical protein [Streptococcus suis]